MADIKIDLLHAFGSASNSGIRDCVFFTDEDTNSLIWPVGKHITVRSLESNEMNFIREPTRVTKITALALTPEKNRRWLAVAEHIQTECVAQVSVFDMKKGAYHKQKEILSFPDTRSEFFTQLAFSHESRYLCAVSGEPDYIAILWDWNNHQRVIGIYNINQPVSRISINPKDPFIISTTGPNLWKIWKISESTFKVQPSISGVSQTNNYVDHLWIDENIVLAITDSAEMYVSKFNEIVQIITNLFEGEPEELIPTTIKCFAQGLVVGSDDGVMALWQRTDLVELTDIDEGMFRQLKTWKVGRKQPVVSIDISPSEDVVVFALRNNDIGICSLTMNASDVVPSILYSGFHSGMINSMDIALQRPLLATCSQHDSSIRIWNYSSMKCEMLFKLFDTETQDDNEAARSLLSVAFHPSGYYLAAGFVDKIRVFHILYNEMRPFREISIKQVSALKFSHGGHLLACASGKVVYIYSAYSLEQVEILKNHANTVTDLAWGQRDLTLTTVGSDGGVYEYPIIADVIGKGERESNKKSSDYSSVIYTMTNTILACGIDTHDSILRESTQTGEEFRLYNLGSSVKLNQICHFESTFGTPLLVAGCKAGNLHLIKENTSIVQTIAVHSGSITKLLASPDGRYLFSSGEDGSVYIYLVTEAMENQLRDEADTATLIVDEQLADIVLIRKSQLENFKSDQESDKQEIENMKQHIEHEKSKRKQQQDDLKKHENDRMLEKINRAHFNYEGLRDDKIGKENDHKTLMKNLTMAHDNGMESVESMFEEKLKIEETRYTNLEKKKNSLKSHYENEIRKMQMQNESTVEDMATEFRDKLKLAQTDYEKERTTSDSLKMVYEERLAQQEDEHETEVQEKSHSSKQRIETLAAKITKYKNKNKCLIREQKHHQEEKDQLKLLEQERKTEIERLKGETEEKEVQIESAKNTQKEIQDKMEKKEEKIYEYKFSIKDKQKTKHVLEANKREMIEDMQPKDEKIAKRKDNFHRLSDEFELAMKKAEELKKTKRRHKEKISELRENYKQQAALTKQKESNYAQITNDIFKAVTYKEPKAWVNELKLLYQYVNPEVIKALQKDPQSLEEMDRQLQYMQRSIVTMKDSSNKVSKLRRSDMHRRTVENSELISELTKHREEKREYEIQIKNLIYQIKGLTQAINLRDKNIRDAGRMSKQASTNSLPPAIPQSGDRKGSQFVYTGRLYKGPAFESKMSFQDKQRIMEMTAEVEEKNQQIYYQKLEIQQLRDAIQKERENNS